MKVGIVNDLAVAREALRRVIGTDSRYQVIWMAADGKEATERCRQDTPDVVLMDLIMPVMDGVEATRLIMRDSPCAVLVVTASVAGNFALVCAALNHGAYDAVCTPVLETAGETASAELLRKLEAVERVSKRLHLRAKSEVPNPKTEIPNPKTEIRNPKSTSRTPVPLVAIGSSTGGPAALEAVLTRWPTNVPAAFLIVQHIEMDFAQGLVDWLQDRSPLKVCLAREGDSPQVGVVLVANTADHLVAMPDRTVGYCAEPRSNPFRPSVDVLFTSLAEHWRWPGVAALLTGIGRDGAEGLLQLHRRGWHTIAQDEATSVVYGMPRAAREIGAADRILPVDRIADGLATVLRRWYPQPSGSS